MSNTTTCSPQIKFHFHFTVGDYASELHKVTLPVEDHDKCIMEWGSEIITENIICVNTEGGKSHCYVRHSHLKTVYMEFTYTFLELVQIGILYL